MAFLPLSEQMERRNSAYYKSASTRIHDDFLTYAQSPEGMLPKACAADFYRRNAIEHDEEEKQPHVLEIGVGEGNFARGFLQEMQRQDKQNNTDISERLTYRLADFSSAMLARAEKNLSDAGFSAVETCVFDASKGEIPDGIARASYANIYCSELFSDVPCDVFVREGMKIYSVIFNDKIESDLAGGEPDDPLALALLESLPRQYFLPMNISAAKTANAIAGLLSQDGAFDIFDYGFYFAEDFALPPQIWNSAIVREYGGQWTADLNFIYLAASLASSGFSAKVEPQKDFAEKAAGRRLALSGKTTSLDYERKKQKSKKADAAGENIEEFDAFYHLGVSRV